MATTAKPRMVWDGEGTDRYAVRDILADTVKEVSS